MCGLWRSWRSWSGWLLVVAVGVLGAVSPWFYRQFLRLRTGLRRIRRVAQFGGVPWAALAGGGRVLTRPRMSPSHRARQVGDWRSRVGALEVKSMVKSRRLRRALCNGGRGRAALFGGGCCLWSPSSRIPRRCRRPEGTIPAWRCPAGSLLLATGSVRPDTASPGWLCKHRRQRRGIRDNPTCGKVPRAFWLTWSPPRVRREVDPVHTTGVLSRIPRRCRRAQPSRSGRWCQAGRFRTPAAVMRLDTTGPACFPQATTATRDPGQTRPQAATAAGPRNPAPTPVAEARRRPCS